MEMVGGRVVQLRGDLAADEEDEDVFPFLIASKFISP